MDHEEYAIKNVVFELETKDFVSGAGFSGYAAVYGNSDFGGDIVMPGAFKSAFEAGRSMPKMLWQHDPGEIIGLWEKMTDDERGLKINGRLLPEIQRGREAEILLKAGAISGLSIGYRVTDSDYITAGRKATRQIKAAELFEVSLVTFPMNPLALVTDVKQLQSPREVETILRSAGVPAAFAKLVALHGFAEAKSRLALDQREADEQDNLAQKGFTLLLSEIQGLKEMMKNG
jgi:HK97 family phage prohead protease